MPTSQNQTQNQTDEANRRIQLIQALARAQNEVVASRAYIKELEAQVKRKTDIITEQTKAKTLSDAAIKSLQIEVSDLLAAVGEQQKAVKSALAEVEYLKKELKKTQAKLSGARKLNFYLILGVGVLTLTTILK